MTANSLNSLLSGGWTIVKKTVLQTTSPAIRPNEFDDFHVVEEYHRNDVDVLPNVNAMSSIIQLLGFHQIHFYCYKKSVGRKVSIMTKKNTAGQQVLRYFTERDFGFPNACGSFEQLPEDTSILAQHCEKWGRNSSIDIEVDKWGSWQFKGVKKMVTRPFAMEGSNKHAFGMYHVLIGLIYTCDDDADAVSPYNPGDTLQISVR